MKTVFKKIISSLLILALVLGQTMVSDSGADAANAANVPEQITISATNDPSKVLNFTWTVKDASLTAGNVLQVMEKALSSKFDPVKAVKFTATARKGYNMPGKLVIKAVAKNLKPDTEYLYRVGNETANIWTEGSFKTIIDRSKDSEISFVYIADPQVGGTDSKAASASFELVYNKYPESSFTYVAGDFTNDGPDETEWEGFFNGGGIYPNGGQKLFANKITVGTPGNHDWAGLDNHFSFPSTNGLSNVYSFDAGPVHFVVLNTNYCDNNVSAFQNEMAWLEQDVNSSQKPWKIVLAHKPAYSGGLEINYETDMKFLRQNLVPVLTRLGIDALLGGHDHSYSRGFVDLTGNNVKPSMINTETAVQPKKISPDGSEYKPVLFMCNCTSGAFKWYPAGYYTVDPDDPLAKNYAFLEKNSATLTYKNEYQGYIKVSASNNTLSFISEMFHYDLDTDKITKEPFVYDKYTVVKSSSPASQNPSPVISITPTPTRKVTPTPPPTRKITPTPTPKVTTSSVKTSNTPVKTCKVSGYVNVEFDYSAEAGGEIRSGFDVGLVEKNLYAKTDANGYFELINIPMDSKVNTITISKPGYLKKTINNVTINGDMELFSKTGPIIMMAGDIDQNNAINMADIMKIAEAFNSVKSSSLYRIDADFNADGAISMADIMISAKRFNTVSS